MTSERTHAFLAALFRDLPSATAMLAADPSLLNVRCLWGETPLHYCVMEDQLAAVHMLVAAGGKVNTLDDYGSSVLSAAMGKPTPAVFDFLLEQGADPLLRGGECESALARAVYSMREVELLPMLAHLLRDRTPEAVRALIVAASEESLADANPALEALDRMLFQPHADTTDPAAE